MQWKQKKIHDIFHASLLTPYHETTAHGANYLEPPPDIIDGEEEYEVEKILDSKRIRRNKRLHYLIQWKGYSEAHDTWESEDNVKHVQKLVKQFHHQYPTATRQCYLSHEDHNDKDPSTSPMSSNASQNSLKSDLSLPINWIPYPALPHDNNSLALSPALGSEHDPMSLSTTVSRLTITNPRAVRVVRAAPVCVTNVCLGLLFSSFFPSLPSRCGYFLLWTAYLLLPLFITCFTLTVTVPVMHASVPIDTRPLCTLCTHISSLLPYVSWHHQCTLPAPPICVLPHPLYLSQ